MKFRKKPVVIEAVRFNGTAHWEEAPRWLIDATRTDPDELGALWVLESSRQAMIRTLEGRMVASDGDWIIQGVKGEIYPCKPEIFAATYEPATESQS